MTEEREANRRVQSCQLMRAASGCSRNSDIGAEARLREVLRALRAPHHHSLLRLATEPDRRIPPVGVIPLRVEFYGALTNDAQFGLRCMFRLSKEHLLATLQHGEWLARRWRSEVAASPDLLIPRGLQHGCRRVAGPL